MRNSPKGAATTKAIVEGIGDLAPKLHIDSVAESIRKAFDRAKGDGMVSAALLKHLNEIGRLKLGLTFAIVSEEAHK